MRRIARSLAVPSGFVLLAAAALSYAAPWSAASAPRGQDPGHEEHEEGPLHEAMEHMKAALRRLKQAVPAGDAATALPLIAEFQANVLTAKLQTPELAEKQPAAEKDKFVAEFRGTLVKLLRVTCDLELALLEGRKEDAKRILEKELEPMQKPAHERFRDEGEEEEDD